MHNPAQVAAVPAGGWLLNSGAATAVGKIVITAAKAKSVKTINLVRTRAVLVIVVRRVLGAARSSAGSLVSCSLCRLRRWLKGTAYVQRL